MLIKRTISGMIGKGSINHNCRKFHAENTDPKRSHWNVEYCNENIKDVYHELFDEAVERYNAKQTRKDRCIDDYYEKICSGKQEKVFHEIIMQVGNKDDCASDSKNGRMAAGILDEYMKDFQKRNPTLRVFSAHLHMDEATPHLHIDFVPYITGSKRGVDTRVSLKQALGALGFKGGSRSDTELNQWMNAEKEELAKVMERHGIEWEKKGTHEEHLSVLEFKKKERAKEVANLENQLSEKREDMQVLENALEEKLEQIEILESRKEDAEQAVVESNKKAEIASKKAETAKKNLQAIAPLASNVKSFAGNYVGFGAKELPEAGVLETGKSYREKKAIPFVEKLRDILFSLYREYCKLQDKYERLERECDEGWERKARWERRCGDLEERVKELEEVEKDYGRVRNVLGHAAVVRVVRREKERERIQIEEEKERRKLQRKNSRDAR